MSEGLESRAEQSPRARFAQELRTSQPTSGDGEGIGLLLYFATDPMLMSRVFKDQPNLHFSHVRVLGTDRIRMVGPLAPYQTSGEI